MRYSLVFLLVLLIMNGVRANDPPSFVSIDAVSQNVTKYGQFELNIELLTEVNQCYNYDSIVLSASFLAPDGTQYTVDGFYFQDFIPVGNGLLQADGEPFWKIRFSPTQAGTWIYSVTIRDTYGVDSVVNQSFSCFNNDNGGFVRQALNKSFLINDEGQSVFLIGENIAWANAPDGSDQMTYYLQRLQAHEMNFAKLMMTPWCYQIEWEGGIYNYATRQKQAFLMDSIFDLSSDYGIYLQLAFSIHNELSFGYPAEDWTSNPYNIANGGMCTDPHEFFSNQEAKSAFKNRLRYLLARWGYASNLIGWELLSEADNFSYYSQSSFQIANWSSEMASYLKQNDVNQHLVTVGFALPKNNPAVWNSADIGFTQMHLYNNVADIEGDVFRQIGMYLKKYNKPVLIGEFGLGHIGDTLVKWDPDGIAIHNTLWTSALSGSFGAVVPWFWENYIDLQYLYPVFQPIARFTRDIDFVSNDYAPVHFFTSSTQMENFMIEPNYNDLVTKTPSKYFQIYTTGQLVPGADSLVQLLYGPTSIFAGLRNPPEINAYWSTPSLLTIETGSQASNSILQISIDETVVFEQAVAASTEYSIAVPQGSHTIKLDNIGTGFFSILEINHLVFHDFRPQLRAFGLMGTSDALVWLHNSKHNWKYIYDYQQLPPTASGELVLPFTAGMYQVEWFNTYSGTVDSTRQYLADETGLIIEVVDLEKDIALKVTHITSLPPPTIFQPELLVYPNPFNDGVTFALQLSHSYNVNLQVYNLNASLVYEKNHMQMDTGIRSIYWDGNDTLGNRVPSGIYFYKVNLQNEKLFTGKLMIL